MVEKSLVLPGNPRWPDGLRDISEEAEGGGSPPSPRTMQAGSPTLYQLAHGIPRGHLVQASASCRGLCLQEASASSLMVHSKSQEHLSGAQAQPSLRHNESGEETKQDGRAVDAWQGELGYLEIGQDAGLWG